MGAHTLSGNVFEPRALNELIPNWKQEEETVRLRLLSLKMKPSDAVFKAQNDWNGAFNVVANGTKAEELVVEVYPGFAAKEDFEVHSQRFAENPVMSS
ncbi:hypothetical protein CTI12_AA567410 [Artemisia annua]|uniref:Electron transfer flavoprotein-ubiquinone oxidoreductase n=1 Tax=Artemisia annua TaxID=35608 RepID=A0A2U1KT71_ARTAN|nr:hypothetical protein CTI12_AA567410 [Artemisia annua]